MDTLTHALSGVLLARATEPSAPRADQLPRRTRLWIGFLAGAFPDGDFVLGLIDPLTYLTSHRGVTHSIVMLPIWAILLALAFAFVSRRKYSWRAFVGVCALAIGIHIAGDVITAFGTMILAPFSSWRAQFPVTFIVDPVFSAIIVAGLAVSAMWKRPRLPAIGGLAVLAVYVGFQAVVHGRAVAFGEAYAEARKLDGADIEALPQPFSPFNWRIVVSTGNAYRLAYVNLAATEKPAKPEAGASWLAQACAAYYPAADVEWTTVPRFGRHEETTLAEEAWNSTALARYRRFSRFPALYRVDNHAQLQCVWFEDLRFELLGRPAPFLYGACRQATGAAWATYRLIRNGDGREVPDAAM
jgi:inner membrane protein